MKKMAEKMTDQRTIEFELDITDITRKIFDTNYPYGFNKEVFDFDKLSPDSVNNDYYIDTLLSTSIYDFLNKIFNLFNSLELKSQLSISFDEPMTFHNPEMSILYWEIMQNMPGKLVNVNNPVNVHHAYHNPDWDNLLQEKVTKKLLSDFSKKLQKQGNDPETGYNANVYHAYSNPDGGIILTQEHISELLSNNKSYLTFAYYLYTDDIIIKFPSKFKFRWKFYNFTAAQKSWKATVKIDFAAHLRAIFEAAVKYEFIPLLDQKVDDFIEQKMLRYEQEQRVPKIFKLIPLPPPLPPNLQTQLPTNGSGSSRGGKKTSKKEVLGKMRYIYKIPGDRKEYVRHKGKLITIKDYKALIKQKVKPKKKST